MRESTFKILLIVLGISLIVFTLITFYPAFISNPDVIGVLKAGFTNPYASTYSVDLIVCWIILSFWIIHERSRYQIKNAWVCIPLSWVLGVAIGFVLYFLIRMSYFSKEKS